jgi:hypothetical protein
MKRFGPHNTVRQRQKVSLRTIAYVSAFCIALVGTGLVIFINLTQVHSSKAQAAAEFVVEGESFVTDKSLPNTIAKPHPLFGPKTQFIRKAKTIPAAQTNIKD